MSILDLPEALFFIESIEMEGCVFKGREREITTISKQIWEGSHSIFSFIFGNKQCVGVKDIINEWIGLGTQSILFYVPKTTLQEIRQHLSKDKGTQFIANEIENYLVSKIHKNLPNAFVFSLNNERDKTKLSTIFDIESLKKELERTNTSNTHQLYLIGLPFKPYGKDIDFYLNDQPIAYEGGMLLGHSKIFTQRLEKGTILVTSDDGIRINFFNTNNYESNNENINYDLKSLDFEEDTLHFELNKREATMMESKNSTQLFFSRVVNAYQESLKEEKTPKPKQERTLINHDQIGIELESFYVPFYEELEQLNLLLIEKNGKNILVGGEYHPSLSIEVIAQITVDIKTPHISIKNHSKNSLVFEKYNNNLWRLNIKKEEQKESNNNMYTNILNNSSIETFSPTKTQSNAHNIIIKPNEIAQLETKEIEFNDSNLYRDATGVLIRYSQFEMQRFDTTIQLNRNLYQVSEEGSLLDVFVQYDASNKSFIRGAKVQKSFNDLLSRAISSKSIELNYRQETLNIENKLDENYYIVQVLSSSQKYILEQEHKNIDIKKSDLNHLKIDIINKSYRDRPLIRFTLTHQG